MLAKEDAFLDKGFMNLKDATVSFRSTNKVNAIRMLYG